MIQDLQYRDLKTTNDEVIAVLHSDDLKDLKSLLLNLRPLIDFKNAYSLLLFESDIKALQPISKAK